MGAGDVSLNTESDENTMDFVERIVNGGKKKPKEGKNLGENMADKLDGDFNFNFPSIPPYEGI